MQRIVEGTIFGLAQKEHVMVIGEESIGFKVLDDQGNPVDGAEVTVTDMDDESQPLTSTTDKYGNAAFNCNGLSPDEVGYMNLSIVTKKDNKVIQEVPYTLMRKGSIYGGFTLTTDTKPELISAAFDNFDILVAELEVYNSPRNTANQKLELGVRSAQPFSYDVSYTNIEGKIVHIAQGQYPAVL